MVGSEKSSSFSYDDEDDDDMMVGEEEEDFPDRPFIFQYHMNLLRCELYQWMGSWEEHVVVIAAKAMFEAAHRVFDGKYREVREAIEGPIHQALHLPPSSSVNGRVMEHLHGLMRLNWSKLFLPKPYDDLLSTLRQCFLQESQGQMKEGFMSPLLNGDGAAKEALSQYIKLVAMMKLSDPPIEFHNQVGDMADYDPQHHLVLLSQHHASSSQVRVLVPALSGAGRKPYSLCGYIPHAESMRGE